MEAKYTAIIIEPRNHRALHFVMKNFAENLSDEWHIILFHGTDNIKMVKDILRTMPLYKDKISLVNLTVPNINIYQYNQLFYSNILIRGKTLYDYIPTETFLVFQTDTLIITEHKNLINKFLDYDYVGAPWIDGDVGNGGLSLRKKSKMLEIISKNMNPEKNNNHTLPEDLFFSFPLGIKIYKPTYDDAKLFSIEQVFSEISFGCHKPWGRWHSNKLFKLYPSVRILYELNN